MILDEFYTLQNGLNIPKLGLGTWLIDDSIAANAVRSAVEAGYRHIDTAQAYENERGVGEGVRTASVARDQLFVTTKVAAEIKDYDEAARSIDRSLEVSGLDYFDLMIIHCPQPWAEFRSDNHYYEGNRAVWRALEEAYKAGKLRAIGVSNFLQDDIENILSSCEIKPMINQIECHIKCTPHDVIDYCRGHDILMEAYSPIAHGNILDSPDIKALADKYAVTVPQLCIRYTLQLGAVSLPKSAKTEHIISNSQVDFTISDEDMDMLMSL